MILVQMGSHHEGNSETERKEYMNGLRDVIHQLQTQNLNDFRTVASKISEYRSSFLKDPSRVIAFPDRQ